jgi:hypothetical protein
LTNCLSTGMNENSEYKTKDILVSLKGPTKWGNSQFRNNGRYKMIKKTWSLDSIKIYLTNDKGDEVVLNSGDLTDTAMNEVIDDVEKYVKQKGGELE